MRNLLISIALRNRHFVTYLGQLQKCTGSGEKCIVLSHSEWALPLSFLHCFIAVKQLIGVTGRKLRHRGSVMCVLADALR